MTETIPIKLNINLNQIEQFAPQNETSDVEQLKSDLKEIKTII